MAKEYLIHSVRTLEIIYFLYYNRTKNSDNERIFYGKTSISN